MFAIFVLEQEIKLTTVIEQENVQIVPSAMWLHLVQIGIKFR
jgi:hypothetical protein